MTSNSSSVSGIPISARDTRNSSRDMYPDLRVGARIRIRKGGSENKDKGG